MPAYHRGWVCASLVSPGRCSRPRWSRTKLWALSSAIKATVPADGDITAEVGGAGARLRGGDGEGNPGGGGCHSRSGESARSRTRSMYQIMTTWLCRRSAAWQVLSNFAVAPTGRFQDAQASREPATQRGSVAGICGAQLARASLPCHRALGEVTTLKGDLR